MIFAIISFGYLNQFVVIENIFSDFRLSTSIE